jgi:2-polyprenyl-6-methoxyphenol hydroxylase-like FAD-dependent oxidoreductase
MPQPQYDIVTVGGGLGGSALAMAMAKHGARVLVLEQENRFRDRVRGEGILPWGVEEMRRLGIYELIRDRCGRECRYLVTGSLQFTTASSPLGERAGMARRDLVATTPQHAPSLSFFHPAMQETLLAAAAAAGAEVRRGVTVTAVTPGVPGSVRFANGGRVEEIHARLIVGADGRNSIVRKWGGFEVRHDPQWWLIAGVLLEGVAEFDECTLYIISSMRTGREAILFPLGEKRARAYLIYEANAGPRLSGETAMPRFTAESVETGIPGEFYADVHAAGPLATFNGADHWIEHPYRSGLVLIGDAAASSDPTFGQGLSLTVRDVRVLRDYLLADNDWDAACDGYAGEHDRHYGAIHRVSGWWNSVFWDRARDAGLRRKNLLPLLASEPGRIPDHFFGGPDLPSDESTRRHFFGED